MKPAEWLTTAAFMAAFLLPARAESGLASVYWEGTKTASGERLNRSALTAAHRTLPFGTRVRVTHKGRSVVARINDRGPFIRGRVIDLTPACARAIGIDGLAYVTVTRIRKAHETVRY